MGQLGEWGIIWGSIGTLSEIRYYMGWQGGLHHCGRFVGQPKYFRHHRAYTRSRPPLPVHLPISPFRCPRQPEPRTRAGFSDRSHDLYVAVRDSASCLQTEQRAETRMRQKGGITAKGEGRRVKGEGRNDSREVHADIRYLRPISFGLQW